MIPNRRLAELATGHLWRSPDPAPSQAQHGGSGLCPVKSWQQGPSRGHVPLGQEGAIVTGGLYPKAKSSGCKSRADTPGGSSTMGTRLSLPCSPSAQSPQGAKGHLCCWSRCPAPHACQFTRRTLYGSSKPPAASSGCEHLLVMLRVAVREDGECPGSAQVGAGSGQRAEVGP